MTDELSNPLVSGSGMHYHSSRARPELLQPPREGEHVWMALSVHVISVEGLRNNAALNLDAETLAQISVGCYVCEQPYSERMSYRKCPGDPSP